MRKWEIKVLLFLLLAFGVSMFASEDTIILGTTDRVTELSFANSSDFFTWHILRHTTKALVGLAPGTNELIPAIAESWDISVDGLTYTFHIRPEVTFWDGEPCDANAVKLALERTIRLNGPNGMVYLIKDQIENIQVVDDLTIRIVLKMSDATFLMRMSDCIVPSLIYSPKSTLEDDFANGQYAGTGPYRLVEYVSDQYVKLEAYVGYFGPVPATQEIIWKVFNDSATLRTALENEGIDVAFRSLPLSDILELQQDPDLQVLTAPSRCIRYLLFNVSRPPVDDPLVRQAIAYAVDRDAIVWGLFHDLNDPIFTLVPHGLPPADSSLDVFPLRNLETARELLHKAGYSESSLLQVNLWYTPEYYGTLEADVTKAIAEALEETGIITVNTEALEWATYEEHMSSGAFDMFLHGWSPTYPDASNFLAPFITESPEKVGTFFNRHPNYDAYQNLMEVAQVYMQEGQRSRLYHAIQALSSQDVIWIPLWAHLIPAYVVARSIVGGLELDHLMNLRLDRIYKGLLEPYIPDIAGIWVVNESREITFSQEGKKIKGTGYQIIDGNRQSCLTISGFIGDNGVDVSFQYEITWPEAQSGNKGSVQAKLDGDWIVGIWKAKIPGIGVQGGGPYRLKKKGSSASAPEWIYYKGARIYPNTFTGKLPDDGVFQRDVIGCPDCVLKQFPNGQIIIVYCDKHTTLTFDDGRVTNIIGLRQEIKSLQQELARLQAKITKLKQMLALYEKVYSLRIRLKGDFPLNQPITVGVAYSFDILGTGSLPPTTGRYEGRINIRLPNGGKAVVRVSVDKSGKKHYTLGYNHKIWPLVDGVIRLEDGTELKVGANLGDKDFPLQLSFRMNVTKLIQFLDEATRYYWK